LEDDDEADDGWSAVEAERCIQDLLVYQECEGSKTHERVHLKQPGKLCSKK